MNLIVVVDRNWAIGRGGDQLVYLSADLKRFQALTMGHTVILGRKTLKTFPGGRPLPGRTNLILSRTPGLRVEGAQVCSSLEEVLARAGEDAFVIGGESVYRALLPWCGTAYVTKVEADYPADCWFPDLDAAPDWRVAEEEGPLSQGEVSFRYVTYRRARGGTGGD